MSKRLTDEYLQRLHDNADEAARQMRALIAELMEHRARIAAHAAAHPERLSEEAVDAFTRSRLEHERRMAIEIQQRRAADLTPAEVEAIKEWREELRANAQDHDPGATTDTIPALDKILRAHGASE